MKHISLYIMKTIREQIFFTVQDIRFIKQMYKRAVSYLLSYEFHFFFFLISVQPAFNQKKTRKPNNIIFRQHSCGYHRLPAEYDDLMLQN